MTDLYQIKVYYTESDSENPPEDRETYLPFLWKNLDVAKGALKAIKEHYEYFEKYNSYSHYRWEPVNHNKVLEEAKTKPWFVLSEDEYWQFRILLPQDDGTWAQTSCDAWCGYFESLKGAEIEPYDDEISFRL